jgi:tRNA threonylcarbamoyladenosine biosynthesis protein TsaE
VIQFQFDANDESATDRFGAALAHVLPSGSVVALVGTLGAGKTRLVQAVAKSVGIDPRDVVSPTFVLVHEYAVPPARTSASSPGRKAGVGAPENPDLPARAIGETHGAPVTIYHLDAYRIKDDDEFRELGPEEYFESAAWTFIEWADRVANCLPRDYMQVAIEVTAPTARQFTVTSKGERFKATIDSLRRALPSTPYSPPPKE